RPHGAPFVIARPSPTVVAVDASGVPGRFVERPLADHAVLEEREICGMGARPSVEAVHDHEPTTDDKNVDRVLQELNQVPENKNLRLVLHK
ncbi:MAG TPA: hypothetical protein VLB84_00295, partial [Bacteroidia bacterium]|nr:hypothetical protein [Bacteroidia bacterium]